MALESRYIHHAANVAEGYRQSDLGSIGAVGRRLHADAQIILLFGSLCNLWRYKLLCGRKKLLGQGHQQASQ